MTNIIDFCSYKKKKNLRTNQSKIKLHNNGSILSDLQMSRGSFGSPPIKEFDLFARIEAIKASDAAIDRLLEELKAKVKNNVKN